MNENFAQAKKLIEQSQTILLTTHARTDGDDLGTVLALAQELIRQNIYNERLINSLEIEINKQKQIIERLNKILKRMK